MADNEEGEKQTSRGNEWEVVSLTASAYGAAPDSKLVAASQDDNASTYKEEDAETSNAMFMSGHFVFPPSQHENLPLEHDYIEFQREYIAEDDVSDLNMEEGDRIFNKGERDWDMKGLSATDEFPVVEFMDESRSYTSLQDVPQSPKSSEEETYDGSKSNLPCQAWWKRRAGCFYGRVKDANAYWSIFITATILGLVILGERWQHERWQKMGKNMMAPISRLKDVIVGGHRRGSFIRASASSEL